MTRSVRRSVLFAWAAAASLATFGAARADEVAPRVERLVAELERRRQDQHIAGMSFALVRDGELLFARGFGERDLAAGAPVTEHTLFAIGSTTKAFTATLIAMLADRGKMSFDDPVSKYLPYFHLSDESADEQVALRDLLCHRTGVCRQSMLWINGVLDRRGILERVQLAALRRPFRSAFQYNNVMFLAAGMAAAEAAGIGYEELCQSFLFDPLGMTSTTLLPADVEASDDWARGYTYEDAKGLIALPMRDITNCAPAGAIFSNAVDMSRWVRMLLAHGVFEGERLVSEENLARTFEAQRIGTSEFPYGLGWFIKNYEDQEGAEHGGNIDGYSASVGLLPGAGIGYALLTSASRCALQTEIYPLTMEYMLGEPAPAAAKGKVTLGRAGPALGPAELEAYVGRYDFPVADGEVQVRIREERLEILLPSNPPLPLQFPDEDGRWAIERSQPIYLRFQETETGFVTGIDFFQNGKIHMRRIEQEEPLPLTVDELWERTLDAYGSETAEAILPFVLRGKIRHAHQGLVGDVTVWVTGPDRFLRLEDYGVVGRCWVGRDGDRHVVRRLVRGLSAMERVNPPDLCVYQPWMIVGDWYDTFDDIEVVRSEWSGGREQYVVKCLREGASPVLRFLDAETGLLTRDQGAGFTINLGGELISYSDHRDVEGVRFPMRQVVQIPDHGDTVTEFEALEPVVEPPAELWDEVFAAEE